MIGLVNYDSDESTEETISVKTSTNTMASQVSVSNSKKQKTAKKFAGIAAVLPKEIRDLLERGGDEDDDESWSAPAKHPSSNSHTAARTNDDAHQHTLFSLLPKPQIDIPSPPAPEVACAPKSISATMDTRTSTKESDEEDEDQASDDEKDNGTQHTTFFSLDARSSADVQASGVPDSETLTIAPPPKKYYSDESGVVWQEVSDGQGGSYFWNRSTNETTWDRPKAESLSNPPLNDESHRQEPHFAPVPQDSYQGVIPEEQSSGKARRMRQRDLERSLESGNLSALTAGETEVLYQPDVSDWNPHQNGAQMPKKEVITVNATINYLESYFFCGTFIASPGFDRKCRVQPCHWRVANRVQAEQGSEAQAPNQ
jgi:hypothetical protein